MEGTQRSAKQRNAKQRKATHLVELGIIGFPDDRNVVALSPVNPTIDAVGANVELAAREPPDVAWAEREREENGGAK